MKKLFAFTKSSPAALILVIELVVGIGLILLSLYAFADIAKDTLFDYEVVAFDQAISHLVYSLRTPALNEIMHFISFMGADFILVIATVFLIFLLWKHHRKESFIFFITLLFSGVLNLLLKELFQRARPSMSPLFELTSYSFPSGHAMNSFAFYITFAYFTYHFTKKVKLSILVSLLCGILILLIGTSRVYLGVHYPSDVIAGYIAGFFCFVFVLVVERTFIFFNLFRHFKPKKKYISLSSRPKS